MNVDFPWRKHTNNELLKEYDRVKNKLKKLKINFPLLYSKIGFKCSNIFFQYERMNTPGFNRGSTIEYWNKKKSIVTKFSEKQNRDIFSTLNFFNHSPSQFPTITAGQIYKYFGATKIFDPFAGWGDRCLAAMALDIDYIGIDCNQHLKEPFNNLIKMYKTNSSIDIIFDKCENINIDVFEFDLVFTSPPFWTKDKKKIYERYNNIEKDYNIFLNDTLIPVLKKCLKRNIWVCLYIPEDMYNDIKNIIGICQKEILFKTSNLRTGNIYCWKKL